MITTFFKSTFLEATLFASSFSNCWIGARFFERAHIYLFGNNILYTIVNSIIAGPNTIIPEIIIAVINIIMFPPILMFLL